MNNRAHVVRKRLSREEISFASMRFGVDKLKEYTRRDLHAMMEKSLDNINDYVLMFSEEVIDDQEHPEYGATVLNLLAYPKSLFNGGAFQ